MHKTEAESILTLAIAGGGSGGHSVPLLAIADEFKEKHANSDIFFVTTQRSVEERIIQKKGYPYFKIPSGKLNGQSRFVQLLTLLKLPFALLKSFVIIFKKRPFLAISAGGYAGAPFIMAAKMLGVRTVIYEQNRHPGMAIRLMSRFADLILLNYESAVKNFPNHTTDVVGLPCRKEIEKAKWSVEDVRWSEEPLRVFITGGSQGAMGLNQMLVEAMLLLGSKRRRVSLHHQTGMNDIERVSKEYAEFPELIVKVEGYVNDMQAAYDGAHLVICRAGASTLVELAAAGKAAILVPLVSRDNHQVPNAQDCVDSGAAIMILQKDGAGQLLASSLEELMEDRKRLMGMSQAMGERYLPGATSKIVAHLSKSQ